VVDSEQQYIHLAQVVELHQNLYSRPFVLPTSTPVLASVGAGVSQGQDLLGDSTFGSLDSTMVSSEMTSEVSVDYDQVKVRLVFTPSFLPSISYCSYHDPSTQLSSLAAYPFSHIWDRDSFRLYPYSHLEYLSHSPPTSFPYRIM
jgi:hypothetical protein